VNHRPSRTVQPKDRQRATVGAWYGEVSRKRVSKKATSRAAIAPAAKLGDSQMMSLIVFFMVFVLDGYGAGGGGGGIPGTGGLNVGCPAI
jgi:hypothetical protein